MEKFKIFFMLYFISVGVTLPTMHGMDTPKDPQSVQNWFETTLPNSKEKLSKLHFFFHDIATGKNATTFTVAQLNTSLQPPYFGVVRVADDALRVASTPESKIIGRAQGICATASLEETAFLMTLNFVFTDGEYNGSTLSLHGYNPIAHKYREMPIVGGSGVFRLARGIATARTVWSNFTAFYFVIEYDVVVLHY